MIAVAPPTGEDVVSYLEAVWDFADMDENTLAQARSRITNVATVTKSYCRGVGFGSDGTVAEDIAAVIVSATARELNVSPGVIREQVGSVSFFYDGAAYAFSLRELTVLNGYRRRAT